MKVLPQNSGEQHRPTYDSALSYAKEVYGRVNFDLDDLCVGKIDIEFDGIRVLKVNTWYNKVKITPESGSSYYWPIQPHKEEMTEENGLQLIKRKLNAT